MWEDALDLWSSSSIRLCLHSLCWLFRTRLSQSSCGHWRRFSWPFRIDLLWLHIFLVSRPFNLWAGDLVVQRTTYEWEWLISLPKSLQEQTCSLSSNRRVILLTSVQIVLPKYNHCTVRFMKHILQGKRNVSLSHWSMLAIKMPTRVLSKISLRHQSRNCTRRSAEDTMGSESTFRTIVTTMCPSESSSGLYS